MIFRAGSRTSYSRSTREPTFIGKVGISLFFLIFFGMGMMFEVMMVREIYYNILSRTWPKVECTVLESQVITQTGSSEPYIAAIQYSYVYQDRPYQNDLVQFSKSFNKNTGFGSYSDAQDVVNRYPADTRAACHVNPSNPAEAYLKPQSLWLMVFVLVPTIFVVVGAAGMYGTWFGKAQSKSETLIRQPKSKKNRSNWFLVLFGLFFFGAGIGILYPIMIKPLWTAWQAQNWVETPCNIISAQVQSHHDNDGTTYSINILYEYVINDKSYRSDRYDFINASSSGYDGKQNVVQAYRKMKQPTCFVDPKNPTQAVLKRQMSWKYLLCLLPLPFIAIGLIVMIGGIRGFDRGNNAKRGSSWLPESASSVHPGNTLNRSYLGMGHDSFCLKPKNPTYQKLLGALVFCLFWNGLLSVFLAEVVSGFHKGHPQWGLTLFMIPFVLVGTGLIIWVIYQFLALFNPRFELRLEPYPLHPGSSSQLSWTIHGKAGRIRELTIQLIGREEVTYQAGTRTQTDKRTFREEAYFNSTQMMEIRNGQVRISIPEGAMHSFEAKNNRIVWLIEIHGEIARWPDVKEEYILAVHPKPTA